MMRADPKTVSKVNKQLAKYCEDNDFIVEWYMWCLNEGDREIDHSTWESCALGQFLYTIGVPEVDLTDIMIGLVMDILACCSLTYRLYLILSSTNCEFPTYKYLADIMACLLYTSPSPRD